MLPILIQLGRFELRTMSVFLVMAFLVAGFMIWRKGREEHYLEDELFDAYLLSLFWGMLWARVGFIALHFDQFGLSPFKWLDVVNNPGAHFFTGLIVAGIFMYQYSQRQRWDAFEILDFWVLGVSAALVVLSLGWFLDGTGFGLATNLPWGIVFPGVFDKHHPVQLYMAGLYVLLFAYLSRVEYRYRTYNWYRAGRNSAQTGFLTCVFIFALSAASLGFSFIMPGSQFYGIRLDQVLSIIGLIFSGGLLFNRSGRTIQFWKNNKRTESIKHFKV
jgi:prolipoprotein diacylglyceryltransferase